MSIIEQLASRLSPEEALYYDWQYDLARRISQILEERDITQREFAKRARLTEAQVSALMHCGANPTLSMLARISALLESELLTWVNSDLQAKSGSTAENADVQGAAVYHLADYQPTSAGPALEFSDNVSEYLDNYTRIAQS